MTGANIRAFNVSLVVGVFTTEVEIVSITSGSVIVFFNVYFSTAATWSASTFAATLSTSVDEVFPDFGTKYGAISASNIESAAEASEDLDALGTTNSLVDEDTGEDLCAIGEYLCSDLECSAVPCDIRSAFLAGPELDLTPPVITLLQPTPFRVVYDDATSATGLVLCNSERTATCLATAYDSHSGDATGTLTIGPELDCAGCSYASCLLEQAELCYPGTYSYVLQASDEAGNHGSEHLVVKVVEEALVQASVSISVDSSQSTTADEQADMLEQRDSDEALAFRQGVTSQLNNGSTTIGEDFQPGDINITEAASRYASMRNVSSGVEVEYGESFLDVNFTILVSVADFQGAGRRRQLLDEDDADTSNDLLTLRVENIFVTLLESTQDGSMSTYLAHAVNANNATLATNITGPAANVQSARLTSQVDSEAAFLSSMHAQVQQLSHDVQNTSHDVTELQEDVVIAGGNAGEWSSNIADLWIDDQDLEFVNIDELMRSANQVLKNQNRTTTEYKLVRERSQAMETVIRTHQDIQARRAEEAPSIEGLLDDEFVESLLFDKEVR
eukprot:gene3785-4738_t